MPTVVASPPNRTNGEGLAGPAREGLCLLQGMLLCSACGRRLGVRYTGNGGIYPIYQCIWKHREALAPHACLTVPAAPLDQAITERLVGASASTVCGRLMASSCSSRAVLLRMRPGLGSTIVRFSLLKSLDR